LIDLEKLYLKYKHRYSSDDPVWFLHNFKEEKDIEVLGLIASCYAYGQIGLINKFISEFLKRINNKPHEFIANFDLRRDGKILDGMNYRFNNDMDLKNLIENIKANILEYGSLLNLFLEKYSDKDEIDLGIWGRKVDKSKLLMPVDVHVYRVSRKLKLIKRNSCDMKFAIELTDKLKKYDASDPVKYDFALCHEDV